MQYFDNNWLIKNYKNAFNALPEPYQNDSCLEFWLQYDRLYTQPKDAEKLVLGSWAARWDEVTQSWITLYGVVKMENEQIAYVLTRFENETWLDAALRVACEKSNEPEPKQQTKNSVTSVYRDFIGKENSEEKAAWLTCQRFNLLEFIKL